MMRIMWAGCGAVAAALALVTAAGGAAGQRPVAAAPASASADAAGQAFDAWIATLPGEHRRPTPDGPIVIDTVESDPARDSAWPVTTGFFRWCEARDGAGIMAWDLNDPVETMLAGPGPALAYQKLAVARDAPLLDLSPGEARSKFSLCTDVRTPGLGHWVFLTARDCDVALRRRGLPYRCRVLIYDRRAVRPFDDRLRPLYRRIAADRAAAAAARLEEVRRWRATIAPGSRSSLGLVIAVNGAVAQVQDDAGRTRWFPVAELEPR